jgi:subtilase family serine protease
MKRLLAGALLAASALAAASWVPARGQNGNGRVILPDSSIEQPGDRGIRAHTNHLILAGPAGGLGPGGGMTPAQIRGFYNLPSTGGTGVIAIVDAYDCPTAVNDFNAFSANFGLPQETGSGGVFQVVYASGSRPRSDPGWALEAALDIEWTHAMAPGAKIVLVEAASNSFSSLLAAVDVANTLSGVTQVSMSWGGSEFSSEAGDDAHFTQANVVYFAASGDTGGQTIYPGVSPNVVSAGGTSVKTDSTGYIVLSETGWSGSGGGPSKYEPRPVYQNVISGIVGNQRGTPDFSFDADPNTGVAVYDTTRYQGHAGWWVVGGTSAASPSLAGIVNLAGGSASSTASELAAIYGNLTSSGDFRDITSGTAGSFSCKSGWDFVTGVGSNQGLNGK